MCARLGLDDHHGRRGVGIGHGVETSVGGACRLLADLPRRLHTRLKLSRDNSHHRGEIREAGSVLLTSCPCTRPLEPPLPTCPGPHRLRRHDVHGRGAALELVPAEALALLAVAHHPCAALPVLLQSQVHLQACAARAAGVPPTAPAAKPERHTLALVHRHVASARLDGLLVVPEKPLGEKVGASKVRMEQSLLQVGRAPT